MEDEDHTPFTWFDDIAVAVVVWWRVATATNWAEWVASNPISIHKLLVFLCIQHTYITCMGRREYKKFGDAWNEEMMTRAQIWTKTHRHRRHPSFLFSFYSSVECSKCSQNIMLWMCRGKQAIFWFIMCSFLLSCFCFGSPFTMHGEIGVFGNWKTMMMNTCKYM